MMFFVFVFFNMWFSVQAVGAVGDNREFLWEALNKHKNSITVRFACDEKNQISVAFTDPDQPDYVKGRQAIVRMATANVPPSRRGYMKVIYTGAFLKNKKILYIRKRDVKNFMKELNTLSLQTFKNKEMAIKEYDEKIKYCNGLPKSRQQKCYESSSGYQPGPPGIFIWIKAEETKSGGRVSLFDPSALKNLKNFSCYSRSLK